MTIESVEKKISQLNDTIRVLKIRREEKEKQIAIKSKTLDDYEKNRDLLTSTANLLQQCNVVSRDFIKTEVETLITQAIQSIFDKELFFKINFVQKRNQIEAEFMLLRSKNSKNDTDDILYEFGGGIVDVIGTALRLVILQLLQIEGPVVLDEPGKNISVQYIDNFGKFLIKMSEAFNRQIIMVTHNISLSKLASNLIEINQINGVSSANRINL
jgi:ABC-type lipoprotein export system ATPase subunit